MGGSTTTVANEKPWKPMRDDLRMIANRGMRLYNRGGFAPDPYEGDRVAGFGGASQDAHRMISDLAGRADPTMRAARGTLAGMMNPDYQSDQLAMAKQNALGSAIPAAASMFSGSGMANSSAAMDGVGRAAMEAVAPWEYNAMQAAQDRAMQAAQFAPTMQQASYLPALMLQDVGMARDDMRQRELDAERALYYEGANQEMNNLLGYAGLVSPLAGMGGVSRQRTQENPGVLDIMGGIAGLVSAFSDRRLKRNIAKIGATPGGANLYSFEYLWSPTVHVGVMADEVPDAVAGYIDGFAVVDYGKVA